MKCQYLLQLQGNYLAFIQSVVCKSGHQFLIFYLIIVRLFYYSYTSCGKVTICQVLKRTKCIVLNSLDQSITDIKLKQKDGTLLMTEEFSLVPWVLPATPNTPYMVKTGHSLYGKNRALLIWATPYLVVCRHKWQYHHMLKFYWGTQK